MTLAERLQQIANQVDSLICDQSVFGNDTFRGAAVHDLRALATEVESKVLVIPYEVKSRIVTNGFNGHTFTHFPPVLTDTMLSLPTFIGHGINHADALVNLQKKADGL